MARKTNIRSIRFSDELAELIDQQAGENFTQKFEALITRCVWDAPAAEKKIKMLEDEIKRKHQQLDELRKKHLTLRNNLVDMEIKMDALDRALTKTLQDMDVM